MGALFMSGLIGLLALSAPEPAQMRAGIVSPGAERGGAALQVQYNAPSYKIGRAHV